MNRNTTSTSGKKDISEIFSEVEKIQKRLEELEKRRYINARLFKILVWGDYGDNKPLLEKVVKALRDEGYMAFLQEELKGDIQITDHDCSVALSNGMVDLLLLIDGRSVGTGVEAGIIIKDKALQERTILLTKQSFDTICDITQPYLYYPIYETYQDEEELIKKAIGMVKKETYRRVTSTTMSGDGISINTAPTKN